MIKKILYKLNVIFTKKIFKRIYDQIEYKRVKSNLNSFLKNSNYKNNYIEMNSGGINKNHSYLLSQYCKTNGKICDELQLLISQNNPLPKRENIKSFFFPEVAILDVHEIVNILNDKGYFVFDKVLDQKICDNIFEIARNMSFTTAVDSLKGEYIDFNSIKGEVCNLENNDILKVDVIRKLICDDLFIAVAEKYFNSEVIFDFPAMWWSFPFPKRSNMDNAQYFHFDFDRVKWLKVFIYLVDVDENNGPHSYIEKSHKTDSKPVELLKRGYARISDQEIRKYYKHEDIKILTAKKGTIIFGDTKCWHKGNPLISGHRLLVEFQYTSSLYGALIKGAKFNKDGIDNFDEILKFNPQFFDNVKVF